MSSPFDSSGHLPKDAGTGTPAGEPARSSRRMPAARTLKLAGQPLPERRNPSRHPAGTGQSSRMKSQSAGQPTHTAEQPAGQSTRTAEQPAGQPARPVHYDEPADATRLYEPVRSGEPVRRHRERMRSGETAGTARPGEPVRHGEAAGTPHPGSRTTAPHAADRAAVSRRRAQNAEGRRTRARRRRRAPRLSAPRLIIVIAAAVLVALALCRIGGVGPFAATDSESSSEVSTSAASTPQLSASEVTAALKRAGIDTAVAEKAGTLSEGDPRFAQIAQNIDAYRKDGSAVQKKLVKLAVDDPEAVDFVAAWPDSYPQKTGATYDGTVEKGQIPQLYQWDTRWGYTTYSGTSFALTGCCPTSLSMVYMGLTGKTDMTPYDLGVLAGKDGYESKNEGTIGDFLTDDAAKLGLVCRKIDIDSGTLKYYLNQGYVIICNVGPGDFTDGGHYFVITGLDGKGKLTIRDPYSSVRSAKHWGIARILNQTIALYAFTTAK